MLKLSLYRLSAALMLPTPHHMTATGAEVPKPERYGWAALRSRSAPG